jgi:hypothetical protein
MFWFFILKNLNIFVTVAPHRRCHYFDVVVGLVWSYDSESCAGSSDDTGMASRARRVKGDDPDKKGYLGPPGWGLGLGMINSHQYQVHSRPSATPSAILEIITGSAT